MVLIRSGHDLNAERHAVAAEAERYLGDRKLKSVPNRKVAVVPWAEQGCMVVAGGPRR